MLFMIPTQGVECYSYYTHSTGSKSVSRNQECVANPESKGQGVCGNYVTRETTINTPIRKQTISQILRRNRGEKENTGNKEEGKRVEQGSPMLEAKKRKQ